MAMTRAATLGALAALGVPTLTKQLEGPLGDFIDTISTDFQIFGVWMRWSWAVFALVIALTFVLLLASKDR